MYTYVRVHVQSAGRVSVHALHVPAYLLIQPGAADIWRALAEATNFAQSRESACATGRRSARPLAWPRARTPPRDSCQTETKRQRVLKNTPENLFYLTAVRLSSESAPSTTTRMERFPARPMSQRRVTFEQDPDAVENGAGLPHILIRAPTGEFDSSTGPVARDKSHTTAASTRRSRLTSLGEPVAEIDIDDSDSESSLEATGTAAILGLLDENHAPRAAAAQSAGEVDIDSQGDLLDDVQPDSDARDHTPAHPSILGLRMPGIDEDDTDHIKSQTSPH